MGTYSLTGLAVIFFVFLSSSFLIWNASLILVMLGQPIEVSYMTADFIRYMIPGVPFLYFYEIIRKVFQSRNEAMPMLIAGIVNNGVNIVLGYYLVHYTEWGWMGAALARTAGNIVLVPTVLMMVLGGARKSDDCTDLPKNWDSQHYLALGNLYGGNRNNKNGDEEDGGGRNENDAAFLHHLWEGFIIKEALSAKAIWEFLSIGFPGMLQVMFEWCAWEAIALLCGILPNREEAIIGIGANTIIMNVSSMCYMLYLGASVAGSVRVGNALGAGDVHRAEIASKITMLAGAIMALINVVLLLRFRRILPVLFTKDWDMATKAQHLLLVAAAFQLPDALNGAIQGIFRGSGRMALGATWNFVAYYIIGIPLGYVLGIKLGFGVEGLWWGMTAGLCTISIGCTMIVLRSNWTKLALEATSRLNQ